MNRRIIGMLAALCLTSACEEKPVGQMEPIPRPPDRPATPARKAEAPKPVPPPPPDPSKVVLRWKLDTPTAFRLTLTSDEPAPPPSPKRRKGKAPEPAARMREETSIFVLRKTDSGDYAFRIAPRGEGGEADQGTMSERGFVLDGLAGPLRNTAVLVLELPREPVGPDATWSLGTDLVDLDSVAGFVEQKAERRNQVKLTALTPAGDGEQVATLEYDLSENLSGQLRATHKAAPKSGKEARERASAGAHDDEHGDSEDEAPPAPSAQPVTAEVRVKGRGEFLVKAGRWRAWEATLTTRTQGITLPGTAEGERKLTLTPLDPVPPELLEPQAKK